MDIKPIRTEADYEAALKVIFPRFSGHKVKPLRAKPHT